MCGCRARPAAPTRPVLLEPAPYVDEEGYTRINLDNVFGRSVCPRGGWLLTAVTVTRPIVQCFDNGGNATAEILGLDLEAYDVAWQLPAGVAFGNIVWSVQGDLLVESEVAITAAEASSRSIATSSLMGSRFATGAKNTS